MIARRQFEWLPFSDNQPLPIEIEPQPLDIKLIIVGDRLELEEFEYTHADLFEHAIYGEYEPIMFFDNEEQLALWMRYIKSIINANHLPKSHLMVGLRLSLRQHGFVKINLIYLLIHSG